MKSLGAIHKSPIANQSVVSKQRFSYRLLWIFIAIIAYGTPAVAAKYDQLYLQAASQGDLQTIRQLLPDSVKVDVKNTDDETPLILAIQRGHIEVVEFLLRMTANLNAKTKTRLTPLMAAARSGRTAITHALLEAGAQPNSRNVYLTTPLMMAAQEGHTEIVQALLEAGADVNLQDRDEATAADLADQSGHMVIHLLLRRIATATDTNINDGLINAAKTNNK
jgi:ankyrin repeat protein